MSRHLEDAAFQAAITHGAPVWIESPDRSEWIAYDPDTDYQLRLVKRSTGNWWPRVRWCLYATNDQNVISQPVMCEKGIDASIHIAENHAIRGRLHFPTLYDQDTETP